LCSTFIADECNWSAKGSAKKLTLSGCVCVHLQKYNLYRLIDENIAEKGLYKMWLKIQLCDRRTRFITTYSRSAKKDRNLYMDIVCFYTLIERITFSGILTTAIFVRQYANVYIIYYKIIWITNIRLNVFILARITWYVK